MANHIKFKWLWCATCLLTMSTVIQCLCCAKGINFSNQTTDSTTQQATPHSGIKNNNSTIKNGLPDVSKHRNINLLPTNCGIGESDIIYGGIWTRQYEVPWLALLAYNSSSGVKLKCGGSIINEWYVLTAAHCVSSLSTGLKLAYVVLGEYDISTDPDCQDIGGGGIDCAPKVLNISIAEVIVHPGYSPRNLQDDIALLRLTEKINISFESLRSICLPITRDIQLQKLEGVGGWVAGWGTTEIGQQTSKLRSLLIPFLKNEECEKAYRINITNRQICAGGVTGRVTDSCVKDSGGPLMYIGTSAKGFRQVQRGIVSFGSRHCELKDSPGVYTNVAYYMDWILDNMHE